jgi:hypothetical protein
MCIAHPWDLEKDNAFPFKDFCSALGPRVLTIADAHIANNPKLFQLATISFDVTNKIGLWIKNNSLPRRIYSVTGRNLCPWPHWTKLPEERTICTLVNLLIIGLCHAALKYAKECSTNELLAISAIPIDLEGYPGYILLRLCASRGHASLF